MTQSYEPEYCDRPTEAEFQAARVLAERDDEFSELAYQICRWYRGQMFIRDDAEKALLAIRNDTVPHRAKRRGLIATASSKLV